jgi:hypothetical protein
VNTTIGLLLQGAVAGLVGLSVAVFVLSILKNQELGEVFGALQRRFLSSSVVPMEVTEISS